MISIQEVAKQAGVSSATVSRVSYLPDKVTDATHQCVEQIAKALGYTPNASAASAAGYASLAITTDYQLAQEDQAVNLLFAGNVNGMVLVVSRPATSRALKRLKAAKLPYAPAYNRHAAHSCVSVDSEQAVIALVARLAQFGHSRITLVSGQQVASDWAQQRLRGFQKGRQAVGLKNADLLDVPFMKSAAQDISQLLLKKQRPTALVCSNDLLALRSIRTTQFCARPRSTYPGAGGRLQPKRRCDSRSPSKIE